MFVPAADVYSSGVCLPDSEWQTPIVPPFAVQILQWT
jgi:hypothetical protein